MEEYYYILYVCWVYYYRTYILGYGFLSKKPKHVAESCKFIKYLIKELC
jgi:hypothetical protein